MQATLEMDTLSKKQCVALRSTLQDAYKTITQVTNDNINVHKDVAEMPDEQWEREWLACKKSSGQQRITDWLGQKRKRMTATDGVVTGVSDDEYGDDEGHEYLIFNTDVSVDSRRVKTVNTTWDIARHYNGLAREHARAG